MAEAHTFFVGEGEWLVHNTNPVKCVQWLNRQTLPTQEVDSLNSAIQSIRDGTRPAGVRHWGKTDDIYRNVEGVLPDGPEYKIFDVAPKVDDATRGTRRIVVGNDGKWYYTNQHYNEWYRIK